MSQHDNEPGIIHGRPDFDDHRFGIHRVKRHPPYVFGVNNNSALVHKIAYVDAHWWKANPKDGGASLVRLQSPRLIASTVCQQTFFLESKRSRTCQIPDPAAVLCGRCHGTGAVFDKHTGRAKSGAFTRQQAHVKLGCLVKGY